MTNRGNAVSRYEQRVRAILTNPELTRAGKDAELGLAWDDYYWTISDQTKDHILRRVRAELRKEASP